MVWDASLPILTTKMVASPAIFQTNQSAVQSVLSSTNLVNSTAYIPNTHPVFFYANTAPTGWTLVTSATDCLLALKATTGSTAYNATGGTVVGGLGSGHWDGSPYALIANQLPNISTNFTVRDGNFGTSGFQGSDGFSGSSGTVTIAINSGGGQTHQHDWGNNRPYAALGILCTKNA